MPLLLHVDVPIENTATVLAQIESCCTELGDKLIGRRIYYDIGEVLLVIYLTKDEHLPRQIKVLNVALQTRQILSFQSENTNLVEVRCFPPCDIRDQMSGFPLQPNESWFPAFANDQAAYLCTRSILLKKDQETWLEAQKLDYQYV